MRSRTDPAPRWDGSSLDPFAVDALPEEWARRQQVVPVALTPSTITVATSRPADLDLERAIGFATGRRVELLLATPDTIARALDRAYRVDLPAAAERAAAAQASDGGDGGIIGLVDTLIAEGIAARASDIHLEQESAGLAVKHRVDGLLRHVRTLDSEAGVPLVSRIKIMAGLDIADRLRPQDGRIAVASRAGQVDVRVSTLPAAHGEKVVLRILDARGTAATLDSLGVDAPTLAAVARILEVREGMILVTGPTGSGKTTTLYAALGAIRERGVNIVTVEDPVEYRLAGIAQVQISTKTGLTFAAALRSILRQDPDVILVGEIRDRETAAIAVQAALTGHLVLSTLHTIDAPSVVARLEDLGVERYKIASALKGVLAQRLVRRLCPGCRVPDTGPPALSLARWFPAGALRWREGGCVACSGTGYRGRLALVEALEVSPPIERAIAAGEPPTRVGDVAFDAGMRRLWEAGVAQVGAGATSVSELTRVVDLPFPPQVAALVREARERRPDPLEEVAHFDLLAPP
ncbi:MAG TPA: GspE/PulE family protein [Gemmatimonadaceae bacterium]|nr:GspE/PulE family protein [Gemmatimonadaceae bacterium]